MSFWALNRYSGEKILPVGQIYYDNDVSTLKIISVLFKSQPRFTAKLFVYKQCFCLQLSVRNVKQKDSLFLQLIADILTILKIFLKFWKFQPRYTYKLYSYQKRVQCKKLDITRSQDSSHKLKVRNTCKMLKEC